MSSLTSDFSDITKTAKKGNYPIHRNAVSTEKRKRLPRHKFINIAPMSFDEIRKEIEEADEPKLDSVVCNEKQFKREEEKENDPNAALQDSFDLNFAALSLNTPAKEQKEPENKFATPQVPNKVLAPKASRSLEAQFVTPNNKIPTKVQYSVKMQPLMHTPITKLYTVPETENESWPKQDLCSIPEVTLKKIKVNDVTYTILCELGKGGSSQVYSCFDLHAKVHRAIKVVSLSNPISAGGFINEVNMLKALQYCNRIIKMYDFEIKHEEKVLLVVLEVGGSDLSKILKESALNTTHMPLYMLIYYWMEMLYAVKQIHAHGVIHSDLKPANFLQVDGYLKLIDFGIASCVQSDMTSVFKTVPEGSFNYISPEALSGEAISSPNSPNYGKPKYKIHYKSDVWSLGCILYQLVYRKTPFSHIPQVWKKLSSIMAPEHKIEYPNASWVPEKILATIKACLQRNPKLRPTVDQLILEYEHMFQKLQ